MHEAASMTASRAYSAAPMPASLLRRFADALGRWNARSRQMAGIAHLNDHMLADIGLTHDGLRTDPDHLRASRASI